jgi:hypothetical protein
MGKVAPMPWGGDKDGNLIIPPGEIDWGAVFNGTYDREHPEGRWFDPLKLWNRHYADVVFREADPAVRADPALRRLCLQVIADAGDEETDEIPEGFFNNFMVKLRRAAHARLEQLPQDVLVQYRALVHQDPAPADPALIAFWRTHIPDFDRFYTDFMAKWRREATRTLRAKRS